MVIYLKIKLEEMIFKCFYHKETMFEASQRCLVVKSVYCSCIKCMLGV